MKTHRILVYTENYLPSLGGLENNTALLCESLVSMGCIVTLITPQMNATKHQKFNVIESASLSSVYHHLKFYDLLLVNGGVAFKAIIPALFRLKPFLIIYQMATLYKDIRNNNLTTYIKNYIRKLTAKMAKKNIGVSEYSYSELKTIFGNKSALLINPADPLFVNNNEIIFKKPIQCLIAGRLIEGKGVRLLITAVKEINKKSEHLHLHIIGDGPIRKDIEDASNENFIFYHEPIPKEKLKAFLSQTHLTIIPSSSHIEGSPLIMAESFVMGVPVLVSSQPAMMASVKNKNLIFEANNINSLKEKLLYLTNEINYNAVKQHSLKLRNIYCYSNYIQNLKSILNV